jgi:hypothetical protein
MTDHGLAGTTREQVRIDWTQDGIPQEPIIRDMFYEADGTRITDDVRIAAIIALQNQQAEENRDDAAG